MSENKAYLEDLFVKHVLEVGVESWCKTYERNNWYYCFWLKNGEQRYWTNCAKITRKNLSAVYLSAF